MTATRPLPPPRPAPDLLDDDLVALLPGLAGAAEPPRLPILRERVLDRVARSARASRAFITMRCQPSSEDRPVPGVGQRTLYESGRGARRRGEPLRVRLIELAPGACWTLPATQATREWLLMQGAAQLGALQMAARDYHCCGGQAIRLASQAGALLYLRESDAMPAGPITVADADAIWDDFAPGIKRRLLGCGDDGEASMLYHALPGAAVPRHGHGHDEECLMLEGELFVDEVLLRSGDYQLAPAGTVHGGVFTDTGVVLFAHGDRDLAVMP